MRLDVTKTSTPSLVGELRVSAEMTALGQFRMCWGVFPVSELVGAGGGLSAVRSEEHAAMTTSTTSRAFMSTRDCAGHASATCGEPFSERVALMGSRRARAYAAIMLLHFPQLTMLPLDRYSRLLPAESIERVMARVIVLRALLSGRVIWNVSSTAVSGGVAEMVRSLLSYARGAGVDARWAVIGGPPEFFRITKRIHNAIHGSAGDGSPLGETERKVFEEVNAINAAELAPMVRPRDVVLVHDPQPAALVPALPERGAFVIWRCHIGHDEVNDDVERGWQFLAPYLRRAHAYVFSRAAYIPTRYIDASRAVVIPPSIDPFSAKNQHLDDRNVLAILEQAGLVHSGVDTGAATFTCEDGTPGRVDRRADVVREGPPPGEATPLVVQVSRWDRLKDPSGVLEGFVRVDEATAHGAHLVLAGPNTLGVGDDPEGANVHDAIVAQWCRLPEHLRRRVHLASLPTDDVDENAAMVNALQRHATVIVQKSLHEGFGLTVTEGMWKSRPMVASAVGGIQDQIDDGVEGILVHPADLDAFGAAIVQLLDHPDEARRMGERGHARVLARGLGIDALLRYGALIEQLDHQASRDMESAWPSKEPATAAP
jgi:trehalose synthase